MTKRTAWLGASLFVGCAMLPTFEPAQIHYLVRTDWDGVPLAGGERVFETDLGYTVGLSSLHLRTTSLELVPCEPVAALELLELLELRPGRAHAHGGSYDHDISAVEPGLFDDLMIEQVQVRGHTLATRSAYCELFSVHGTGRDETVASVVGWYRAPGAREEVAFVAEHPLGVTDVALLPVGAWDDSLLPDEAEVLVTWFPARAFDGLELVALPPIDLAYELSHALLRTRELTWTIGPPTDG